MARAESVADERECFDPELLHARPIEYDPEHAELAEGPHRGGVG